MENIVDINETFDELVLHTPKAIQGGNAFVANISLRDSPLLFQTPKCKSKKGVHTTNKQIYTDLLFTDHDYTFLNWLQKMEKTVRRLIYEKRETWFGGDDDDELTLEDIEYNWMESVKNYKKKYLLRTYFPKNIKSYTRSVSVYDNDENELTLDDIGAGSNLITILEVGGLKFSPTYFNLELNVRQVMVIKDKEIFNKCLIKLNSKTLKEDENYKQNVDTDSVTDSVESNDSLDDYKDETIEEEDEKEKVLADKINVVKVKDIEETNGRNSNTLVKIDNSSEISEIKLEIPDDKTKVELKKPNEVYLEIYKKAREKAKEARLVAIKAYLTAKEIKKQYLLDEIELSEDESDDDNFLFSEK
tara:strand:+ start:517 stop:1596 length:1080 start_codon:yes stop_codon:yes gene_type:complete